MIGKQTENDVKYFTGTVDEVRIYSRALNESEIEALFVEGVEIPVSEQLDATEADILELETLGVVSHGESTSLINKLKNAYSQLEKGKPDHAIKKMEDFVDQVQKLIDQGTLTTDEGDPLIEAANAVMVSIEGGATARLGEAGGDNDHGGGRRIRAASRFRRRVCDEVGHIGAVAGKDGLTDAAKASSAQQGHCSLSRTAVACLFVELRRVELLTSAVRLQRSTS